MKTLNLVLNANIHIIANAPHGHIYRPYVAIRHAQNNMINAFNMNG